MRDATVAVTIDAMDLVWVDLLVREGGYASRGSLLQQMVREQVKRIAKRRLAEECAKLDPADERAMAEAGMAVDMLDWPEY